MKRTLAAAALAAILLIGALGNAQATPSSVIFIPSLDIQPYKSNHFGLDTYFNPTKGNLTGIETGGSLVDVGWTYGLAKNLEVGVDYIGGADEPLLGNVKYALLT